MILKKLICNTRYIVSIAIILFGGVQYALAHATPITYEPESSSLIEQAPDRVRIHFSERIEVSASDITVLGPDGTRVNMGDAAIEADDTRFFFVRMRNAGQGTYTAVWQVVSADDGHFTKGAFTFSVGKASVVLTGTGGQIQIQHITTIPQATVLWIELLGQSLLLGALLLIVGIWQFAPMGNGTRSDDEYGIERRARRLVIAGVNCIVIGVVSLLVLKTFDLEQLRSSAFIPTLRIFAQTLDGMHAIIRLALALAFGVVFFVFRNRRIITSYISANNIVLILIMVGMALSRARVSHSAATHFFPAVSIGITALHLLSKELWIGGLIALVLLLFPLMRKITPVTQLATLLVSFSKIISIALGVAGATGAYITWLDLKKPSYLFASEWGSRFIILLIFAGLFFALRMLNQLVVERIVARSMRNNVKKSVHILGGSYYLIMGEMLIGLVLLFVTSFLIITTPPFPVSQFLFEKHAVSQGAVISFMVNPYKPDEFMVTVADENNNPGNDVSDTIISLINEEKGIGPIVIQGQERFPGGYVIPKNSFSLPGKWQVNITAHRSRMFDASTSFALDYPHDIDATRLDSEHYSFGLFEFFLFVIALSMSVIAWFLYRFSGRLEKSIIEEKENDGLITISKPSTSKVFLTCVTGLLLMCGIVWIAYDNIIKTDFQKQCERDGNFWLQAVPLRDGVALSPDTITGCTLNIGLYHFPDEREYAFFTRPRQSMTEIVTIPPMPTAGTQTHMILHINAVEHGQKAGPIQDLGIYHDRIAHMIIVGEDLKTFAHIHTEDLWEVTDQMKKEAAFPLHYIFPKAGRYTIVVNYVQGGKELSQQSSLYVGGMPLMQKNADVVTGLGRNDHAIIQDISGYHITLAAPPHITSGSMTKLTYTIEKDGKRIIDMQPYLGAAMHLAVVRADLGRVIHTHGQPYLPGSAFFQQLFQNYINYHSHFVPDHFGPDIQARVAFPQPGLYEIFGEFKHEGKVITSSFIVRVE